jgi:hypothetical protein
MDSTGPSSVVRFLASASTHPKSWALGLVPVCCALLLLGPLSATGDEPSTGDFVLRGGRVMTATGEIYERADIWVSADRINAIGTDLTVATDTREIDVAGRTITPGIIDTHSHIGVYAAPNFKAHSDGNEMVAPVTAYARAAENLPNPGRMKERNSRGLPSCKTVICEL